jgi:hypothetical protein
MFCFLLLRVLFFNDVSLFYQDYPSLIYGMVPRKIRLACHMIDNYRNLHMYQVAFRGNISVLRNFYIQ